MIAGSFEFMRVFHIFCFATHSRKRSCIGVIRAPTLWRLIVFVTLLSWSNLFFWILWEVTSLDTYTHKEKKERRNSARGGNDAWVTWTALPNYSWLLWTWEAWKRWGQQKMPIMSKGDKALCHTATLCIRIQSVWIFYGNSEPQMKRSSGGPIDFFQAFQHQGV